MVDDLIDVEPMGAEPPAETGEKDPEGDGPPGYTGPAERCNTCEYFDSESMNCKKYNTTVEEDGHCESWEMGGAGEEAEESAEEPVDLGPLE